MHKDIKSKTTNIDRASLTRHISLFSTQSFGNIGASHITTENASFFPFMVVLMTAASCLNKDLHTNNFEI